VIYGTLYASDLLGSPITSLGAANLRCTEDGTQVTANANPALNLGTGLSIIMILHASPDPNDPPQQILDLQAENLAALAIVPVLFESDRMAVLQMDNGVRVLRDFTEARNREALLDAINAPLPILGKRHGPLRFNQILPGQARGRNRQAQGDRHLLEQREYLRYEPSHSGRS